MNARTDTRRTLAVLSVDCVSSEIVVRTNEEFGFSAVASAIDQFVRPQIKQNGGTVFAETGDGLLAVFPTATKAIDAAIAFQASISRLVPNPELNGRAIAFRVGIDLGEVTIVGESYFGIPIIGAVRLQEVSTSGSICISEFVFLQIRSQPRFVSSSREVVLKGNKKQVVYFVAASKHEHRSKEPATVANDPVSALALLLLIDRFYAGPWGRSLLREFRAYRPGTHLDPSNVDIASITVSDWVIQALRLVPGWDPTFEEKGLRRYVRRRMTESDGIFIYGMESEGRLPPRSSRIRHIRHSAVVARQLIEEGNQQEAAKLVRFILRNRLVDGGWNKPKEANGNSSDPLTTAYVLHMLWDWSKLTFPDEYAMHGLGKEVDDAIGAGSAFLNSALDQKNGVWRLGGSDSFALRTTAEVLYQVPELRRSHPDTFDAASFTLEAAWRRCGRVLPAHLGGSTLDLCASALYVSVSCRESNALSLTAETFVSNCLEPLSADEPSSAAGWSQALVALKAIGGIHERAYCDLETLREMSNRFLTRWKLEGDGRAFEELPQFTKWFLPVLQGVTMSVDVTVEEHLR